MMWQTKKRLPIINEYSSINGGCTDIYKSLIQIHDIYYFIRLDCTPCVPVVVIVGHVKRKQIEVKM